MNYHTNMQLEPLSNKPTPIRSNCPWLLKNQPHLAPLRPECSAEARRLQKARLNVSKNNSPLKNQSRQKLVENCYFLVRKHFTKNVDQRGWNSYCLNFVENIQKERETDRRTNGVTNVYRRHIAN